MYYCFCHKLDLWSSWLARSQQLDLKRILLQTLAFPFYFTASISFWRLKFSCSITILIVWVNIKKNAFDISNLFTEINKLVYKPLESWFFISVISLKKKNHHSFGIYSSSSSSSSSLSSSHHQHQYHHHHHHPFHHHHPHHRHYINIITTQYFEEMFDLRMCSIGRSSSLASAPSSM